MAQSIDILGAIFDKFRRILLVTLLIIRATFDGTFWPKLNCFYIFRHKLTCVAIGGDEKLRATERLEPPHPRPLVVEAGLRP